MGMADAFNRTSLELKHIFSSPKSAVTTSTFNRTSLELKRLAAA